MPYRPMTPIKGPGIVAMDELYDEQEDARQAQRVDAARIEEVQGRGRSWVRGAALLLFAALVALAAIALWPRSGSAPTPPAILSLATLAGAAPATTSFDGQRYTIAFTAANPMSVVAEGRLYATKQGYSIEGPSNGTVEFIIAGPQGGAALGYFDGGGAPNTAVRIVVAASDLTVDGSALK